MRKCLLICTVALSLLFVGCSDIDGDEGVNPDTPKTDVVVNNNDDSNSIDDANPFDDTNTIDNQTDTDNDETDNTNNQSTSDNDETNNTSDQTDTDNNDVLTINTTHGLKAMIIIGNEFGNTYFVMKEELEKLGFTVVTVGVGSKTLMDSCPNHTNVEVEVDMQIEEIDENNINDFSLIFIPAGKHFRTIRYSSEVERVLGLAKDASIYISSVCSGSIVLASFDGLIEGFNIAASTVNRQAIIDAGANVLYNKVVVDGIFVTGDTGYGSKDRAPIVEIAESLYDLLVEQESINND